MGILRFDNSAGLESSDYINYCVNNGKDNSWRGRQKADIALTG